MGRTDPQLVDRIGRLIAEGRGAGGDRPPLIAVVGAQGSGKTTLARAAAATFGAAHVSIDDVYLTRAEREVLAREVHPLFLTRGPPGTHDLGLLQDLVDRLSDAGPGDETPIPDFDKRADDRRPPGLGRRVRGRPSAILIDGWCLGALPEEAAALARPLNALERERDADGRWRRAVNAFVSGPYAHLSARFDAVLFLQAPDFDVVPHWRAQQEADLLGLAPEDLPPEERARLAAFVQYFERLTRRMLSGGVRASVTVKLDRNRNVLSVAP